MPSRPEIERLLGSCDRSSRDGARDFAILILLARLGLRAVEIARLELDDLHWRAGEIEVDGKGHERDRLPLPGDVGEALVEHLKLRGHSAQPPGVSHRPRTDAADRSERGEIGRPRRVPASWHRTRRGSPSAPRARQRAVARGRVADRHRPGAAPQASGEHGDLRQGRSGRLRQAAQPWPGAAR